MKSLEKNNKTKFPKEHNTQRAGGDGGDGGRLLRNLHQLRMHENAAAITNVTINNVYNALTIILLPIINSNFSDSAADVQAIHTQKIYRKLVAVVVDVDVVVVVDAVVVVAAFVAIFAKRCK